MRWDGARRPCRRASVAQFGEPTWAADSKNRTCTVRCYFYATPTTPEGNLNGLRPPTRSAFFADALALIFQGAVSLVRFWSAGSRARGRTSTARPALASIDRSTSTQPLVRRARRRRPARARAPRTSEFSVHARARAWTPPRARARPRDRGRRPRRPSARVFARRTTTRSGRRSTGTESPPSSGVQRLGRRGGDART